MTVPVGSDDVLGPDDGLLLGNVDGASKRLDGIIEGEALGACGRMCMYSNKML